MIIRAGLTLFIAAILPFLIEWAGLWTGPEISHPWWSATAVGRGIVIGVVVAAIALWLQSRKIAGSNSLAIGFALAAVVTAAATWYGRNVFVWSEDFVGWAGQLWNFGFTAFIAALVALIAAIIGRFVVFRAPSTS